ncbi:hypothetical protein WDZ92_52400, partial [Nostoc sp. NIES-2111]
MPNRPHDRLDRRDLVISSMAAVGASAALAVAVRTANAQTSATGPAGLSSGTVYTGEVVQGKLVVSALAVRDLEPGRTPLLYFRGVQRPTRPPLSSSSTVATGYRPVKATTPV